MRVNEIRLIPLFLMFFLIRVRKQQYLCTVNETSTA